MPRSRPTIAIDSPDWTIQITDDASRTLVDPQGEVAFHSASGGLSETRHVYLRGSGIEVRLAAGKPASVLEIGLGTGMGLLLTLDTALAHAAPLRYVALEKQWLPADILRQLQLNQHLQHTELCETFLQWRVSLGATVSDGVYRKQFAAQAEVTVHHGDAMQWQPDSTACFDAIYFDPFAPSVNPELWSEAFFRKLHPLLTPQGKLVTYCVNRRVRETLSAAGFVPRRVPGPPAGKREVLVAELAKSFAELSKNVAELAKSFGGRTPPPQG